MSNHTLRAIKRARKQQVVVETAPAPKRAPVKAPAKATAPAAHPVRTTRKKAVKAE